MPTYEYRCPTGHEFEKFYRKISDAGAEVPCPQCGMIAERMLSAGAGLVFKGSGFYITDYGKDGKGPRKEPARDGEGAKDAKGAEGAGEVKDAEGVKHVKDAKGAKDAPAANPESEKPAKKKAKPRE